MKHEEQIIDLFDGLDPALIDAYFQKEEKLLKKRKRAVILTRTLSLAACFLLLVGLLALSPLRSFFKSPALSTDKPQESRPDELASGANSKESNNVIPKPSYDFEKSFESITGMLEWLFPSQSETTDEFLEYVQKNEGGTSAERAIHTFFKDLLKGEKKLAIPQNENGTLFARDTTSATLGWERHFTDAGRMTISYSCGTKESQTTLRYIHLTAREQAYAREHGTKNLIARYFSNIPVTQTHDQLSSYPQLLSEEMLALKDRNVSSVKLVFSLKNPRILTYFVYNDLLVCVQTTQENAFGAETWKQFSMQYEGTYSSYFGNLDSQSGLNTFFSQKVVDLPAFLTVCAHLSDEELPSFLSNLNMGMENREDVNDFLDTVTKGGYYEVKDFDDYGVTYDERTGNYRFIYRKGETIYCFDFVEKQFGLDEYLKAFTDYTNYIIEDIGFYPWLARQSLVSGNYDKNNDLYFFVLDDQHEGFCVFLRIINMDETLLENRRSFREWSVSTFTYKTDLSQFGKEAEEEVH